jgi:hypothetical protein
MKVIPSTQGYEILVDDEDFERLSQHSWYAHYSVRGRRPARRAPVNAGRKVIYLVHEILPMRHGFVVDHANGNVWDNRRSNLRYATRAQNAQNRGPNPGRRFKGVRPYGQGFTAKIGAHGSLYCVGWFASEIEAALAYDRAALELHGEFARLNLPEFSRDLRAVGRRPNAPGFRPIPSGES